MALSSSNKVRGVCVMFDSPFLRLSGCAIRGLRASKKSPSEAGRSETRNAEFWGRPSGGTKILLTRPGWDFRQSHQKAAWRCKGKV